MTQDEKDPELNRIMAHFGVRVVPDTPRTQDEEDAEVGRILVALEHVLRQLAVVIGGLQQHLEAMQGDYRRIEAEWDTLARTRDGG